MPSGTPKLAEVHARDAEVAEQQVADRERALAVLQACPAGAEELEDGTVLEISIVEVRLLRGALSGPSAKKARQGGPTAASPTSVRQA